MNKWFVHLLVISFVLQSGFAELKKTPLTGEQILKNQTLSPKVQTDYLDFEYEKSQARILFKKLTTTLKADTKEMAARFLKGGYKQDGYGVPNGAAIDGSRTFHGSQGYYTKQGKNIFINIVKSMKSFFNRRKDRLGKPIKLVIKPGIGGQHTPFQGIADMFSSQSAEKPEVKIIGEYELGSDLEERIANELQVLGAGWDQISLIPSSKSGSTDETMLIHVNLFRVVLKNLAPKGVDGTEFSNRILTVLHELNFSDGKEISAKDLFKGLTLENLMDSCKDIKGLSRNDVKTIFSTVLGNMFFETTDRPEASRLSAFVRNSTLGDELGEDAPSFGAMFDNVGGRWTADLHMMTFLAYHNLDETAYWNERKNNINNVRDANHTGVDLGNFILDKGITDIALVLPEEAFWFGKGNEQNFNESIWQNGFANLVTIKQKHWEAQKHHYEGKSNRLVINLADLNLSDNDLNFYDLNIPGFKANPQTNEEKQALAIAFAKLSSIFYGMTETVGDRLIARELINQGYTLNDVNLNDLDNPATKIVQNLLYLRQPYVELGKGLLEARLKDIQAKGTLLEEEMQMVEKAKKGVYESTIPGLEKEGEIKSVKEMALTIKKAADFAKENNRKFVPFIYLEGDKFHQLRDYLTELGVEWVLQGTGDQHISYQQVLAQPKKYLPLIISCVPEQLQESYPAIGFAKGYLDNVSQNMVRDFFAEASYKALTDLRQAEGGLGMFLRWQDTEENINRLHEAFSEAIEPVNEIMGVPTIKSLGKKDINGKNILVRANVNVKVVDGKVALDVRLKKLREIVNYIKIRGGTPVLFGHNGRKKGNDDERINFDTADGKVIIDTLSQILGEEVVYHKGSVSSDKGVGITKNDIIKGKVNLLQNVRMAPEYEQKEKKEEMADGLAALGDGIYVNEAFGDIGSSGASSENILKRMKKVIIGPENEKELRNLETIRDLSFVYFGGKKLDKIETVEELISKIRPGGTIIFGSRVSEYFQKDVKGKALLKKIIDQGIVNDVSQFNTPLDSEKINFAYAIDLKEDENGGVNEIGEQATKRYIELVETSLNKGDNDSILLNGTMGWIENPLYQQATKDVIKSLALKVKNGAKIFLVGDDGPRSWGNYASDTLDLNRVISFTGGGVPLKYISGGPTNLVALKAMIDRASELKKNLNIQLYESESNQKSA